MQPHDQLAVDEALLVRSATDPEAFAAFYDRWEPQIFTYFAQVTESKQLAAELTAETFTRLLADVDRFDPERGAAGAWIYTIASHQYHRYLRHGDVDRRARRKQRVVTPTIVEDHSERVVELADAHHLLPHLLRAMDGLSDVLRSAVVLRVAHDLPYTEVAERLGCSEGAARVRVLRGLTRLRTAIVVAAVGLALAVGAGTLLPSQGTAAADVVVRIDAGEVVVTLEDLEHRPDRIEAAVREAGLDVWVDAVPVGPSRVGRFLGRALTGALPPQLRWVGATADGSTGFALPVGWTGSLRLLVGVPASGDEPYAVFSDALRPGEPLACRDLLGRPAAEVARELRLLDLQVRWEAVRPGRNGSVAPTVVQTGPEGTWPVTGIESTSRGSLVVRLAPPGLPLPDAGASARAEGCPR